MRLILVVLFSAVLMAPALHGQERPAAPTEISPGLSDDLAALSHQDFSMREAASKRLLARKIDAIEPLAEIALKGKAEASVRAFDILRKLYSTEDEGICEAVELSLESLVHSDSVGVAARAESTLDSVSAIRHRRAVASFQKLGGIVHLSVPADATDEEKENAVIQTAIINDKWKGGDDGLKYLRRIDEFRIQSEVPNVAPLIVVKRMISSEALASLQSALPLLSIQVRGPACLGVSPLNSFRRLGQGMQIFRVAERSAAERAGLRPNDVLTHFAGEQIDDFEALVEKISEHKPGDKVNALYSRDGVERSTTIELRSWE